VGGKSHFGVGWCGCVVGEGGEGFYFLVVWLLYGVVFCFVLCCFVDCFVGMVGGGFCVR